MSPPDAGITPAPADGLTEAVRRGSTGDLVGRGPYVLALVLGGVFHGGLLFGGSWRGTYDAWVHIFFADHYQRSWFEMFEPRWYTGFSVASYPPAATSWFVPRSAGWSGWKRPMRWCRSPPCCC
jgi:hypothetical protein